MSDLSKSGYTWTSEEGRLLYEALQAQAQKIMIPPVEAEHWSLGQVSRWARDARETAQPIIREMARIHGLFTVPYIVISNPDRIIPST